MVYSFYFLLAGSRRKEFNSLWEGKGERSVVYCLLGRYICQRILLICSHITFPRVYSFYFLLAGSRGKECNYPFWSQNTEKRNHAISQMRLRSGFKMRMSILNTATTEQMGYGMVSFFVCFLLMNRNPFQNFTLGFYELFIFFPAVLLIFQCDILWCYALYKFPDTFSDKRLMQINMTGMVICKAK